MRSGCSGETLPSVIILTTTTIATTTSVGIATLQNASTPADTPLYIIKKFSRNDTKKNTRTLSDANEIAPPFSPAPTKSSKNVLACSIPEKETLPARKLYAYPKHHDSM